MKRTVTVIAFVSFLMVPLFCSYGGEHIVLYQIGERDPAASAALKKYFSLRGYRVTIFDGTDSLEKQVELANRINRLRAALFIAVEFGFGERESVTIAVTDAQKKTGQIRAIEDVPGTHAVESKEFAGLVAEAFGRKVLELPLFPLLGIDMPGVFMNLLCPKEKADETLGKIADGMKKYFERDVKR